MHARTVLAATCGCLALTLLAAWLFEWSFEKAAFLAPVIVLAAGAAAGLVVLWTRVVWESLRRREHPIRLVALGLGLLAVLIGLSVLGLKLPHE